MTALVPCPRCGGVIHLQVKGYLGPSGSQVEVSPDPFSLRRHAACFGPPNGGGETAPYVSLMPSARGFAGGRVA